MRRWLAAITIATLFTAPLSADVAITTTTTIEGGMAAMTGGLNPKVVTRIKGTRSRTEVELGAQTFATLLDVASGQAFLLRPDQKTAQLIDPKAMLPPGAAAMPMPRLETSVKPTGQTRQIDGARCEEYVISVKMDMSPMAAGRGAAPPGAAAMFKDLRMSMTGSAWVAASAPGAAEYLAFQKSASKVAAAAFAGANGGSGLPAGLDRLLSGFSEAPGIPYLTEMVMTFEGNAQVAEAMRQMGQMKITSRVTGVSVEPQPDALFSVPPDYTVVKK
jgi:hypothetical protein